MDVTLGYLRETLSNHLNRGVGQQIYKKLVNHQYKSEGDFVRDLNEGEIAFLNTILEKELRYAMEEQDEKRVKELNEVYELL
ncbi:sporulation protein [Heyndrickxia shackletonii]|uniref:Sporulation protein n=1 Tax=Heyndrickxia shackletonii TaxID=157838 RepID=A0A0Q3TK31_9BACI|nr:sigma-G-dependent sporulation-specific acid-soluble spore protein CsgA [Heyndrickxia shackletonii]KQL53889.1 sporulation protein [Heyndrickxia shackletonii]MBB2478951.1 sigma-G-dependent sporulation-specific acid-soluble spore protein CsgA [Bacillus sp. APMAM]NEY97835.1 sporulation protein [Heyndrickxia shackletonii]RTZ57693.1 sporulation protein [Bacillus sp. SAJ1]